MMAYYVEGDKALQTKTWYSFDRRFQPLLPGYQKEREEVVVNIY